MERDSQPVRQGNRQTGKQANRQIGREKENLGMEKRMVDDVVFFKDHPENANKTEQYNRSRRPVFQFAVLLEALHFKQTALHRHCWATLMERRSCPPTYFRFFDLGKVDLQKNILRTLHPKPQTDIPTELNQKP